jgi:HD-like signal output (HDOD) protein
MNHAEIGAMVAEKWNFPEHLVQAIRYHHDPTLCADKEKDLVYTVYLANMLCEYENGNVTFDQFEILALDNFGISSKKQIDGLLERFAAGFKKEQQAAG